MMVEQPAKWQQSIREQSDAEAADELIETVNSLLEENTAEVLRQLASELTLNMRGIRNLAQKIQHEADPQTKAAILFKIFEDGQVKSVNVEIFSQMIVNDVAEGRQLIDLLSFYAMALSEQSSIG
jgi:hypothetical protein